MAISEYSAAFPSQIHIGGLYDVKQQVALYDVKDCIIQ